MLRYDRTAIVLHWLIAGAILCQVMFGWFLEDIPRGTPARQHARPAVRRLSAA